MTIPHDGHGPPRRRPGPKPRGRTVVPLTITVTHAQRAGLEARADVDLLLGDLRRLPFADGTFTKAYSLDVLEHLSPDALRAMLTEAARVLAPGGHLFVYTHVRKNARKVYIAVTNAVISAT